MILKKQSNILEGRMRWLVCHPWLKLIALMLAITVWFYIRDEITKLHY